MTPEEIIPKLNEELTRGLKKLPDFGKYFPEYKSLFDYAMNNRFLDPHCMDGFNFKLTIVSDTPDPVFDNDPDFEVILSKELTPRIIGLIQDRIKELKEKIY